MKFKYHLIFEIVILIFLIQFFNLQNSLIVFFVHFIPSLDYLMKKINLKGRLHRQLFHNIFVLISVFILMYIFIDFKVALFGGLNILFHFGLDLNGNGIAIFYPFSKWRLRYKNAS